jgi:hypothetical protein
LEQRDDASACGIQELFGEHEVAPIGESGLLAELENHALISLHAFRQPVRDFFGSATVLQDKTDKCVLSVNIVDFHVQALEAP